MTSSGFPIRAPIPSAWLESRTGRLTLRRRAPKVRQQQAGDAAQFLRRSSELRARLDQQRTASRVSQAPRGERLRLTKLGSSSAIDHGTGREWPAPAAAQRGSRINGGSLRIRASAATSLVPWRSRLRGYSPAGCAPPSPTAIRVARLRQRSPIPFATRNVSRRDTEAPSSRS
jgi:hypothetical protein